MILMILITTIALAKMSKLSDDADQALYDEYIKEGDSHHYDGELF